VNTVTRFVTTLLAGLVLAGAAAAATPQMTAARIGLPGGPNVGRSRNGAWAPIYVTLQATGEGNPQGAFTLAVESTDAEEIPYRTTRAIPALAAGEQRVVAAYTRPGTDSSEFTLKLLDAAGKTVQMMPRLRRDPSTVGHEIVDAGDVLYLTLGARLPGLRRAVSKPAGANGAAGAEEEKAADKANDNADDNAGVPGFAVVEDPALLPDRWYGYEAADVVVLTTGSQAFVDSLLHDSAAGRRDALLEWVRRGGRLVIGVGRNHQSVGKLLEKLPLINCGVRDATQRELLEQTSVYGGREAGRVPQPLRHVTLASLTPGAGTDVLVTESAGTSDLQPRPTVVQAACGLGHVILVAFDLDTPPFSTWQGQGAFWRKLTADLAPRPGRAEQVEAATELQHSLEDFGEIPTISFGWVALFLLAYIALVGPVDYLLLKRVFKRLEWTWVTFPAIVLGVSVAAYLGAYYVKGDDLWVNKVDLVDVDLHGRQVCGTTWWSLFNPRSQSFTVGLEPSAPGWFTPPAGAEPPAATVATLQGPLRTVPGSPGLFRRRYDYTEDATGIRDVPVPVWATRTLTASWRVPVAADAPPVQADFRQSRDGTALAGPLVNQLPVELQGCALFYRGLWYPVGTLLPGQPLQVQSLFERGVAKRPVGEWFAEPSTLLTQPPVAAASRPAPARVTAAQMSHRAMKALLFHALDNQRWGNTGLRPLDESWRLATLSTAPTTPQLQYRAEAILVARAPAAVDRAEAVTAGPTSPSRLWLDALPGPGKDRPPLPGRIAQETYVRVYIPVVTDR
jgi:hypothetical protein